MTDQSETTQNISCTMNHPPEWPCGICNPQPPTIPDFQAGYDAGYDAAVEAAAAVTERLPSERGWTGARTVGVIGILAAAIRNLSP